MLQAATGKLFTNIENPRIRVMRGVLFTNLDLGGHESISTVFGTLSRFDSASNPVTLCYELHEQMESAKAEPGVIVSRSLTTYIDDFADVVSFGLRAICTPDLQTAERLLHQRVRGGEPHPSTKLKRFYDATADTSQHDHDAFKQFAEQLHGLKRASYLPVIQAIRTYVAAVHRMSDDLNLAYTLLVMSIESLAQKFDAYETVWADVEPAKRKAIDAALAAADEGVASEIKGAVLKFEHLRLGHRFAQFILAHLPSDYFSSQEDAEQWPVGRRDLEAALKNLYGTRSEYVHTLKPLTKEFLHFAKHQEVYVDHQRIALSFQGLFRLVRAVILEFIVRADKVKHEPYPYESDNPHLLRMRLDPSMWIYHPDGLNNESCRQFFSGLVELLDQCLQEFPLRKIGSLDQVLDLGFRIQPQLSEPSNRSFVAFAWVAIAYLGQNKVDHALTIKDCDLLNLPSVESLIAAAIIGVDTEWPHAQHAQQLNNYYSQRFKKSGLKVPPLVEACMGLTLAERYRLSGEHVDARKALARAAEDFPRLKGLRELTGMYSEDVPIRWLDVVYPKTAPTNVPTLECKGL